MRKGLPKFRDRRSVVKKPGRGISMGIAVLWALFAGTLLYVAFFSPFLLIEKPHITGMSGFPEETLQTFVAGALSGKYLGIFPRRDFFLVRPQSIEKQLLSEYPRLRSASVTRIFPDGMRIVVAERKKILLWCSAGACSLIDEEGRAHASERALLPENAEFLLSVTDTSGKPVILGEKVLDPDYPVFVVRVSELFPKELGILLEPRFTTVSRFADELRVKTSEGWEVYFGTDIPLESSLRTLTLLLEKELPLEKRAPLAYIDLRAENRVYYAFREGEKTEAEAVPSDVPPQEKKAGEPKKKKQ